MESPKTHTDETLVELLQQAREIWGDAHMNKEEVVVALGVTFGDICRYVRDNAQTEYQKRG